MNIKCHMVKNYMKSFNSERMSLTTIQRTSNCNRNSHRTKINDIIQDFFKFDRFVSYLKTGHITARLLVFKIKSNIRKHLKHYSNRLNQIGLVNINIVKA